MLKQTISLILKDLAMQNDILLNRPKWKQAAILKFKMAAVIGHFWDGTDPQKFCFNPSNHVQSFMLLS